MIYGSEFFNVSNNRIIIGYDHWKGSSTTIPACFIHGEIEFI